MCNLNKFKPYNFSDKCGIYALFLKQTGDLSKLLKNEWVCKISNNLSNDLLYIGKEQNKLKTRIQNKHLHGTIRNSTLRWTIAYMTGMNLYGIQNTKPNDNRKIKRLDEQKITQWLLENTEFKIIESDDYKNLEKFYIKTYVPPLNITYNPNPIILQGERTKNFIYISRDEFQNL